jgi:hypothetical protein
MREKSVARFWSKVDIKGADDCWLWNSYRLPYGYGITYLCGVKGLAHRISYAISRGDIPSGKVVMHVCDNPPCVNPNHLRLGTLSDNAADAVAKGRMKSPKLSRERHPRAKLSQLTVQRLKLVAGAMSCKKLGVAIGESESLVESITSGKSWRTLDTRQALSL